MWNSAGAKAWERLVRGLNRTRTCFADPPFPLASVSNPGHPRKLSDISIDIIGIVVSALSFFEPSASRLQPLHVSPCILSFRHVHSKLTRSSLLRFRFLF